MRHSFISKIRDGIVFHPKKQAAFGKAGRKRVLEMFEEERITTQYAALYDEVLNTPDEECLKKMAMTKV